MSFDLKPSSKGLPLAVGDDFLLFMSWIGFPALALISAVALVWHLIGTAHAETAAEKVFGRWEKVTPETILRPVPDWIPTGTPGAVTNEYRRKAEDGPAQPGRPNISPRSTTPEQVVGLQSNLPERR